MQTRRIPALAFSALAVLASPLFGAQITVNSSADVAANDGACTLREAITSANNDLPSGAASGECGAGSGSDSIVFAIPGAGPHIVAVGPTQLPDISQPLDIDGYSQSGAVANTLAAGSNAVLTVGIDGANAAFPGLTFRSGGSVRGLQITRFNTGVFIPGGTVTVAGNFIGTDGVNDLGNFGAGVNIQFSNSVVGGAANADRNVISGNDGNGVFTSTVSSVSIRNNLINTDRTGTAPILGATGIEISSSGFSNEIVDNVVGGSVFGIVLEDDTNQNTILGNRIGVSLSGADIGGSGWGISLLAGNGSPDLNRIGGALSGEGNIISNWNTGGIRIDRILNTTEPDGNRISGNSLFGNGFGIDLLDTNSGAGIPGPNANDPGDPDIGSNGLQNWPFLLQARWDGTQLLADFAIDSTPNRSFRIEFFQSTVCGGSHGEGENFLGAMDVTVDGNGIATVLDQVISAVPLTGGLAATATDLTSNNTSEFSNCMNIEASSPVTVPTLSSWGLLAMTLLLAVAAWTLLAGRIR